jgi:hypothetical protein
MAVEPDDSPLRITVRPATNDFVRVAENATGGFSRLDAGQPTGDTGGFTRAAPAAAAPAAAPAAASAAAAQPEGPAVSPPAPPTATPLGTGRSAAPESPVAPRGFFDKVLGLTGERYQTWPERMVREGSAVVEGAQSGAYGPPGSREFSQSVTPDVVQHLMPLAVSGAPSRVPGGGAPRESVQSPQNVVDTINSTAPEGSQTRVTINGQTAGNNVVSLAERQSATQFLRDLGHTPESDPAYFADPVKWAEAAGWSRNPSIAKTMQTQQSLTDMGADPRDYVYQRPNAANSNGGGRPPSTQPPTPPVAPTPPAASPPSFLTRMAQGAEKIFSPETVDANADAAVSTIRAATGKAARDTAVTNAALEPYHARVNALPPERQLDFIASVEGRSKPGTAPVDRDLAPVADELRTAFEQRRAKIEALPEHEGMSFVDDYYPHMWQDPNKAAGIINQYRGAPSRQGSGASLKSRTVPTMAEGIEQGLVPVTTNPIDGALRYIQSMDLFIANAQVRNAGKEQGLIRYIRPQVMGASGHPDSFKVPEGWAPLKGRGATDAMGAQAYAPEGYARVYNNFISRGFHDLDPALGDAVAGGQRVSNAITALELGLSGYHALTMMQEAMVNQLARGIGNLRGGKPVEAAKDIAGTPLAPITRAVQGNKLRDVYLGKSEGTPEARQIADLLEAGGGRAKGFRHSPDYEFSGAGSYWTAFKRGALKSQLIGDAKDIAGHPVSGPLAVGARHIGRIMDTVAQPIFEKYIPAIKNGAFYENMSAWLQQNPAAPREQQVRAARQILDSIDNRFGEMVQDNVFWNKALKQVAMLALRSWSWTVGGSFREIGAGVRDTLRAPFKSVNAENIGPNDKRWTQKMDYIIALPVVYGGLSAVYQYLKTGKPPEEMRDLLAPRTGGVDANSGEPERLLIPGYMKDVYGFIEHPWQEMKYKAATAPTKFFEILNNQNWRGDPIRSPRDWGGAERGWLGEQESALVHAPQWMKDYWKYTTESFGPITARNLMRGQKEGSNLNAVETGLGVRTAPRQFIDPEGYGKMMEGLSRRDWQKKLNFEKGEKKRYGGTE